MNEAFREAKENRAKNGPETNQAQSNDKQEKASGEDKSAHEYDLSKERIRGR